MHPSPQRERTSFMPIAEKPTMQNRFVYLFELDSVRTSDAEICAGQQALWNEIVRRGNTVVLTYSQLVDSRGFFSLLSHRSYYESFVRLFEEGHIRISQYGEKWLSTSGIVRLPELQTA
jgi:hypothetical protein